MTSSPFVRRDLRAAFVPWLVAHGLVVGALGVARFLAEKLPASAHTRATSAGLFAYDGSWYRSIAEHGYAGLPKEGLRFFPLYPLLGRWLGVVFLGRPAVALVVIASAAGLVAAALIHRLVLDETDDPAAARRSTWFIAVLPPALCFVLAYAEPVMMVGAIGMFVALRSRRWLPAAAFGVVAGLARPVGFLLVVPAAIEAARGWKRAEGGERVSRLAAVSSPALGTSIYLAWVGIEFGDPLKPFNVQGRYDLRGELIDPVTHVVNAVRDVASGDRFGAAMHLVWLTASLGLLIVIARRLPSSYTAYGAVSLTLALTASNISSFERYVFSTFPFVMAVGLVTGRGNSEKVAVALATGALVGYSVLTFFALYVP